MVEHSPDKTGAESSILSTRTAYLVRDKHINFELMKLSFSYNVEKDVENFFKAAKSVNNPKSTGLQNLYVERFGENLEAIRVREFIKSYIKENNINVQARAETIRANWLSIENEFVKRIEEIFGIQYPKENIQVFLTTNSRCTYNIKQNYFFVNIQSENTNVIIMHELFHFYTWHVFYKDLEQKGLSKQQYNDIKESLTELLNVEFSDLMRGAEDRGYSQHQEMRKKIREVWSKNKDIKNLVRLVENY